MTAQARRPAARARARRASASLAAGLAGVLAVAPGCAARGFVPPSGPGVPAPEAAGALNEAARTCRGASTFRGGTRLSGQVGDEGIGSVGIDTGLTSDGGIFLEARAVGSTIFRLTGTREQATLWLRDDNASLQAAAGDIVEALIGVKLEPNRLLAVLTGCVTRDLAIVEAVRIGRDLVVTTPDAVLYLRQDHGAWRVRGGAFEGLLAVVVPGAGLPTEIRIQSQPGRVPCVNLRVSLTPPLFLNEASTAIDAAIRAAVPAGARPITLEELRAAGPLRTRDGDALPCGLSGT